MNNVSLRLIFDRKNVATKKHQSLVQIEVSYQRKRKYFSTGIKLYLDQWGKDNKVKNHPQMVEINRTLNDKINGIYKYVNSLSETNTEFTFEGLEKYLDRNAGSSPDDSFLKFMEKRIEERMVSETTRSRQRCILRALKASGIIKSFSDITVRAIKEYDDFAKKKCNEMSSVYNYHKVLKTFIREAITFGFLQTNPYSSFKLDKGEKNIRKFLTKPELESIENAVIDNESLCRVRDLFVFCCYTGLAYSDLSSFNFNNAVYTDGMYRIRDCRTKTGTEFNISILEKAMAILRKYSFSLPIISNQKYNSYLKVLGAFCGVKKSLTSHVARHTFATTIAMANGVRIEVISKMLGHSNIKTTQIYAKVFQGEVDNAFNRLNSLV